MMSYLGKKVTKAYEVSQKVVEKLPKISFTYPSQTRRNSIVELLEQLIRSNECVLPTPKLYLIAEASYEMQNFEIIVQFIYQKLNLTPSSVRHIRHRKNLLLIMNYLIKNGVGGFVDEFREHQQAIKVSCICNPETDKYRDQARDLQQFCEHVMALINNKEKLLEEKQLAMLVKQKMKIYSSNQQNIDSSNSNEGQQSVINSNRIDNFLNNYLWKYAKSIDGKLDQIAEILASRVEKYLVEDRPDSFDIDLTDDADQCEMKTEFDFSVGTYEREEEFIKARNKQCKGIISRDLLD